MIVVRNKSLDKESIPNFIDIITNETAIVIDINNDAYIDTFNLSNIVGGITKQDNQYYYFEHDIVSAARGYVKNRQDKNFAYKVYPITNDLVQRIIQNVIDKKSISKWEIFFNSCVNYQKIYLVIKDYDIKTYQYKSYIEDNKLNVFYGISPADYIDTMTIEEFMTYNKKKYYDAYMKESYTMKVNLQLLRELKLKEIIDNC